MQYAKIMYWDDICEMPNVNRTNDTFADTSTGKILLDKSTYDSLNSDRIIEISDDIDKDNEYEIFELGIGAGFMDQRLVLITARSKEELIAKTWTYSLLEELTYPKTITVNGRLFEFEYSCWGQLIYTDTEVIGDSGDTIAISSLSELKEYEQNQNKTTKNKTTKGKTMKETAKNLMVQNKQNAITVGEVTLGKTLNKRILKMIKPKLPLMARSFADHPLAPVILANTAAFAIKQYTDNDKANKAADLMLQAAAFQAAEEFNIDDIIDDLLDGLTIPGITATESTSKVVDAVSQLAGEGLTTVSLMQSFASEQGIDLTGLNKKEDIAKTIVEFLE